MHIKISVGWILAIASLLGLLFLGNRGLGQSSASGNSLSPEASLKKADDLYASDSPSEAEVLYRSLLDSNLLYVKRQSYDRLMSLYIKSGRPDRAIQLSHPFREWLTKVGDLTSIHSMEIQLGDCYLLLGHYPEADSHYEAALQAQPALPLIKQLQALRGRAEVATQSRLDTAGDRWKDLEILSGNAMKLAREQRDNRSVVLSGRQYAEALDRQGKSDEALSVLEPLPDMYTRLNEWMGRRDTQRQRANIYATRGKYEQAAALFQEALDLHRKNRGAKRMAAGDILAEWAAAAELAGKPEIAKSHRDAAAIEYREVMENSAAVDYDGGPLAAFAKLQSITRSSRQFRKALELNESEGKRWSNDEMLSSRMMAERGGLELVATSYKAARDLLAESLAKLDQAEPKDYRALPRVLVNLATAELAGDAPNNAEKYLRRCSDLYRDKRLPVDPIQAECEYLKGALAVQRGDYTGAIALYRTGLSLCDRAGPAADSVRFNLWLNTALVHKEQGDSALAQETLLKASQVLSRFAVPTDISFGLIHAVRAELYLTEDRLKDAILLHDKIKAICDANHIQSGYLWSTVKNLEALQQFTLNGNIGAAERIWEHVAESQRKNRHVQLARTLNFLGMTAEIQGDHKKALQIFEEAKAFQDERPWASSKTRAITLWRLAVLKDRMGDRKKAREHMMQVFDLADQARMSTFGEANQRATFFAQFTPMFETMCSWAARDGDAELLLTLAARSRSRTLLDQILATGVNPQDGLAAKDRERFHEQEMAARRRASRIRAQLQLLSPEESEGEKGKALVLELEAARKEYSEIWREIVNVDPFARVLTQPGFAEQSITQLRTKIAGPNTGVLTYIIGRTESYAVLIPNSHTKSIIYRLSAPQDLVNRVGEKLPESVAKGNSASLRGIELTAIPEQPQRPETPFTGQRVPVGERAMARLIDPYLVQVRSPTFDATRGIVLAAKESPKATFSGRTESIGDLLLPIELRRSLQESKIQTLVVIPDGPLHKIPIESLVVSTPSGPRYALDELPAICLSPSAAVLTAAISRPRKTNPGVSLLTVSDPAYKTVRAPHLVAMTRSVNEFGALDLLPGTAEESRRIQAEFKKNQVSALSGIDATEKNVVKAIRGKTFIHLAAHGFADERFGGLYAAVALTPPPPGQDPSPDDDGFLSLPEIYRLDLSSCELTVLSACVTNVGPQRPLEAGVTLAGAFLSAGSRRVLASCWAVSDRATADLMSHFFAEIRQSGQAPSYPEAMKKARQKIKADPRFRSPFYWAPFVLVGVPD